VIAQTDLFHLLIHAFGTELLGRKVNLAAFCASRRKQIRRRVAAVRKLDETFLKNSLIIFEATCLHEFSTPVG
jgi:hypothetical protein